MSLSTTLGQVRFTIGLERRVCFGERGAVSKSNAGNPECPDCGQPMWPDDQYGRAFACYCKGQKRQRLADWYQREQDEFCARCNASKTAEEKSKIIDSYIDSQGARWFDNPKYTRGGLDE